MFLEEIAPKSGFENISMECKVKLDRDNIVGWLKSIAGFANAKGGDLFIGVEDVTNKLIGFDRVEAEAERNYFNNQVNEHLVPRPQMEISFIRYEIREAERFVIRVHVDDSEVKPIVLKYDGVPSIYMRRDGFTNGATYEEIIRMSVESSPKQYDVQITDVRYDPGDFSELNEFYSNHNDGKKLTDKALRSIGFYDKDGFLSNGAMLFSDSYVGNKTEISCQVFSGFTRGDDRIVTVNRAKGNLIYIIEYAYDFVCQRMNHMMIKDDSGRENIDAFPKRALFEGIVNAVAHRDYYLDGSQIQIDMFKDRLEISSPGGFYLGESFGKTYDLSGIISKRRNEVITAILVMCNVMEAAGTGFDKIIEDYSGVDESHRPYICAASDHFTLVLPDMTYSDGVENEMTPVLSFVPVPNGTDHDGIVLSFCYNKAHSVSEIAEYLGLSDSTYLRKKVIGNMCENDYLIKNTDGRAAYFRTNRDSVRVE